VARWETGETGEKGDGKWRDYEKTGCAAFGREKTSGSRCWTRKKTGRAVVDENKPTECTPGGKRNTVILFK
jgi:hypothetical protein